MDSARTYSSRSTRKLALSYTRQNFEGSLSDMTDAFSDSANSFIGSDENGTSQTKTSDSSTSLQDMIDSMQSQTSKRIRQLDTGNTLREIETVHQKFVLYLWRMLFGHNKSEDLAKEFGFSDMPPSQTNNNSYSKITLHGVSEMYYEENESTSFTSYGTVATADGRTINFNLDVNMSQTFAAYYREEGVEIAAMCDPLVINFNGDPAELGDTKFFFDLDNDGTEDEISTLNSSSGFLALDKNGDGIINNGSELFGTASGDGFADLAEYDSDHNGWIDENDEIFDKLKIWVKDNNGYDKLYSLKDKNVGAIYLGNADTNFTLRSHTTGDVTGAIRKTGLFLYEDGSGVGTVNHLDIAN